jgi:hypothetical protein
MKKTGETRFIASVYRIWMMRHVDVPDAAVRSLLKQIGGKKENRTTYIPVVAIVNGKSVRTTLLPAGGGRYRMQFNATLRKAANADVGDSVGLELSLDRQSREIAVPRDLRDALKEHSKARKAFRESPPGYRRQIIKWMDSAKSMSARRRRIEIVIDRMLERAILKPSRQKDKEQESQE